MGGIVIFEPRCGTTAMGILPHTDANRALSLALSLDVPFWPQLFRVGFHEDSYAQVSDRFPGIIVDSERRQVVFSTSQFYDGLAEYAESSADPGFFSLSPEYSITYHQFLERDLSNYLAIRGQCMGPVSFGLKVFDEDLKPIIYRDDVRPLLFEFLQAKVNAQYRELRARNKRAFVWIDEPGIELLFSAYCGYTAEAARADLRAFFEGVEGPKGLHLCGNPDWDLPLGLGLDILSLDAYHWGSVFTKYSEQIKRFLERGGILSWGLVPTASEEYGREDAERLMQRLDDYWDYLVTKGIDKERLLAQSLLAPATCCLLNADKSATIELAFSTVREVSRAMKDKYRL